MKAYQRTLEGGVAVATGHPIRDQLAAIMEDDPIAQRDEDYLAGVWLQRHVSALNDLGIGELAVAVGAYRKADIRRRRQEMAADGSYPWPTDEAERRQKRAKGGPPG